MLVARNITKKYGTLEVLKGINMAIEEGEIISIVGASGAGKSTLLQILGTLDQPELGSVYIKDTNLTGMDGNKLARFRNQNIGFVFQFHNLLPEFTALENVCMPGFIAQRDKNEVEEKANELLELLNVQGRKEHKTCRNVGRRAAEGSSSQSID